MKKQFSLISLFALAVILIINSNANAQAVKEVENPIDVAGTVNAPAPAKKQMTRKDFMVHTDANTQQEILANWGTVEITDLANATPQDLEFRKHKANYLTVAEFNSLNVEEKWRVLKDEEMNIIVQNGAIIPKIKITRDEYNNLPLDEQQRIRNSSDYIIID